MDLYLLIYFGIGATIMSFVTLRSPYNNEPDVMVKLMARKDFKDDTSLYENVLIKLIVPLVGCLLIVVAWPPLLIWKAKDWWRFRGVRKQANEDISKSVMSQQTESRFLHEQIGRRHGTDDAWASSKVRNLLAKAQERSNTSDG